MKPIKKCEIQSRVKAVIEGNPKMPMLLEVGFTGSKLLFQSIKTFEERVLYQMEHNNVCDIVFEGVENRALNFKTMYQTIDIWGNSKGYGQGKHMGD